MTKKSDLQIVFKRQWESKIPDKTYHVMSKEILLWISSYLPSSDLPKGIHWRRKNLNMLLLHLFHVCFCQDNFLRAYFLLIGYRKMLFFISTITHNFSINFYKSNWWICNQQVAMNIPIVNFSDDYVILFICHSFQQWVVTSYFQGAVWWIQIMGW